MEFTVMNKQLGRVTVQVSDQDADLADRRWHLSGGKGRVGRYVSASGNQYLHRIVAVRMGIISGVKDGRGSRWTESVDHINGDKMDNRRENLRLRTRQQQMANTSDPVQKNNTSGVRGVSYIKSRDKWYASVMIDHKTKSLGLWATREEAVAARRNWDEGN